MIYLLLGAVGIPVFSNFGAGLGYLLGNTGGYAIGFIFIGLIGWLFEKLFEHKVIPQMIAMLLGLIICYTFGTLWFMNLSMNSGETNGLLTILTMCVFPFVIPDILKLCLAFMISKRLKPFLKTDP